MMRLFRRESGPRTDRRQEIDRQHRADLVSYVDDRMMEAIGIDLLRDTELFGVSAAVVKIRRDNGQTVKAYRPDAEARTAGYVPLLWVEFGGSNLQDGCFLEVWQDEERLIEAIETPEGRRPNPLPVANSRVMTVRALNITQGGTLEDPCIRAAA